MFLFLSLYFFSFLFWNRNIPTKVYTREYRCYCQGRETCVVSLSWRTKKEKKKEGKVWGEREAKKEGLDVYSSASCTRRFHDYSAVRNFRGSSDSGGNHPRNWCCLATRSLRATRETSARYFSPAPSPLRHSNKTLCARTYLLQLPVTPAAYFIGCSLVNRMFCRDSSRVMLVVARKMT